jgi:hypothetical protein
MAPSATEGTTQVGPSRVPGSGQELDTARSAEAHMRPQLRPLLENRLQRGPIVTDERDGAAIPMPIRAKRECFLDRDDKKARLSVTMAIVLCTPSSYRLDAKAPRGKTRFFVAPGGGIRDGRRFNTFHHQRSANRSPLPAVPIPAGRKTRTRYLKEGTNVFFIPSSSGSEVPSTSG